MVSPSLRPTLPSDQSDTPQPVPNERRLSPYSKYKGFGVIRRILEEMAELYDIYRVANAINKLAKKIEKQPDFVPRRQHYQFGTPTETDVRVRFRKPHWFSIARSKRKENLAINAAKNHDFIGYELDETQGVNVFNLTRNGWRIIERSFFGLVPKGLWLAWAEKSGPFYNLVFGFIGGIVIGGIGIVIAIIKK